MNDVGEVSQEEEEDDPGQASQEEEENDPGQASQEEEEDDPGQATARASSQDEETRELDLKIAHANILSKLYLLDQIIL